MENLTIKLVKEQILASESEVVEAKAEKI